MKGICFKEQLFNAIIDGRKTMTRRIIKGTVPIGNWKETIKHARYKMGETVYLKEPYNDIHSNHRILYKYNDCEPSEYGYAKGFWENERFMPEIYARHFIQITDVKLERLREISKVDCIKEGIREEWDFETPGYSNGLNYSKRKNVFLDNYHETPQKAFADLIDKINGRGTWDKNPYVFVYEFKLLK